MTRPPEYLERVGQRGIYRPIVSCGFEEALGLIGAALRWASEQKLTDMLINVSGLKGVKAISALMRYQMVMCWLENARGLRIAWVAPADLIDPGRIGVLVAENRGLSGDVFTTESAAFKWLDARI
jgi:hypothetical protein